METQGKGGDIIKAKKMVSVLIVCMLLATVFSTTVSAGRYNGGGGCRGTAAKTTYYDCNFDECNQNYNHKHDGQYYYGHSLTDGHDYHKLCNVADCTKTTAHNHDDVCYFGHSSGDGHGHNRGRCR